MISRTRDRILDRSVDMHNGVFNTMQNRIDNVAGCERQNQLPSQSILSSMLKVSSGVAAERRLRPNLRVPKLLVRKRGCVMGV